MSQTRMGSIIEASVNILIGYFVALGAQIVIFPLYGVHIPLSADIGIGICFTVVSFIRQYLLRRYFNARLRQATDALVSAAEHLKTPTVNN